MLNCFIIILALFLAPQLEDGINAPTSIGDKIWKNECGGKIEGLTHWNDGEDFGSFGIGHFIWYPCRNQERFHETFPEFIAFLDNSQVAVPAWIREAEGCPWKSRKEFYQNIDTPKMHELRQFLLETKEWQATFMVHRLKKALPNILFGLNDGEKMRIKEIFTRLSATPQGLYALVDYANCKGLGTVFSESYKGQGWGLKQVLLQIPLSSKNPLADFVVEAKKILMARVENSPPERNEKRWIKGWFNRLDTYTSSEMRD